MVSKTKDRWDELAYQRMTSATYANGGITVCFEDGQCVSIEAQRLLPACAHEADWTTLEHGEYEIRVQTADGTCEIPWDTIRVLTDKGFSAHRAAAAAEEARLVGRRIRELREHRHLSSKELAERAGITAQSLSRIELGRHDVVLTTLERILAAMGWSLRDLVFNASEPVHQ